jgi:uncharacterized repeat protein (TIGR01451 family)
MRHHIKVFSSVKALLLAWATLWLLIHDTRAQTNLILDVIPSTTDAIPVNSSLTYSIFLTNTLGANLQNIYVTNFLPASAQILNATNFTNPENVSTNGNNVTFLLFQLLPGIPAQMSLTVRPTTAGLFTNTVVVFSESFLVTNVFEAVVNQVTNVPAAEADLSVSIAAPTNPVLVGDDIAYSVTVSNAGPAVATNIVLSNTLPAGLVFRNTSPTNQPVINVGTLTNLSARTFRLLVRPETATNVIVAASVSSTNITEPNLLNNFFTNSFAVDALITNQLIATNLTSPMVFNPQNSLMEQTIRLVNVGASNVSSARVIVTGLTNWLRNAAGTNNGNPFVVYAAPLAPNESVDLLLQYFIPTRLPVAVQNSNYIAFPTSAFSVLAPTNFTFAITNFVTLPSGAFLIEFPATPGRTYTILYNTDAAFTTNTMAAIPSIVAQAGKVQWIDDGPPKTISHPGIPPSRFYRVLLNP